MSKRLERKSKASAEEGLGMVLSEPERLRLCEAAVEATSNAYAPYSGQRVGAAVLGDDVHIGANVENASYGASLCAERSALAAARVAGDVTIRGLAIAFSDVEDNADDSELVPCGLCLQWIGELAPGAEIIICNTRQVYRFPDDLPPGFRLRPVPVRVSDDGDVDPIEEERKP